MESFIKRLFRSQGSTLKKSLPENINLAQGFIFVHVPKTAGTSIDHALGMRISHHKSLAHYKNLLSHNAPDTIWLPQKNMAGNGLRYERY